MIDDESLVKTRTNTCLSYTSAVPSYSVPGGEVHRRNVMTAVGTVVVAMNLGTSSHGNGVTSAMFLASLVDAEQVLQH